jgi:hypothetical protein
MSLDASPSRGRDERNGHPAFRSPGFGAPLFNPPSGPQLGARSDRRSAVSFLASAPASRLSLTVSRSTEARQSFEDFPATTVLMKTLLLQWVPWRRLCQRKKCVIRVVYSRRIGASPFSKSGLFHAPPMQ